MPERISQKFYEYADPVLGRERGAKLEKRILEMSASNDVVGLLAV